MTDFKKNLNDFKDASIGFLKPFFVLGIVGAVFYGIYYLLALGFALYDFKVMIGATAAVIFFIVLPLLGKIKDTLHDSVEEWIDEYQDGLGGWIGAGLGWINLGLSFLTYSWAQKMRIRAWMMGLSVKSQVYEGENTQNSYDVNIDFAFALPLQWHRKAWEAVKEDHTTKYSEAYKQAVEEDCEQDKSVAEAQMALYRKGASMNFFLGFLDLLFGSFGGFFLICLVWQKVPETILNQAFEFDPFSIVLVGVSFFSGMVLSFGSNTFANLYALEYRESKWMNDDAKVSTGGIQLPKASAATLTDVELTLITDNESLRELPIERIQQRGQKALDNVAERVKSLWYSFGGFAGLNLTFNIMGFVFGGVMYTTMSEFKRIEQHDKIVEYKNSVHDKRLDAMDKILVASANPKMGIGTEELSTAFISHAAAMDKDMTNEDLSKGFQIQSNETNGSNFGSYILFGFIGALFSGLLMWARYNVAMSFAQKQKEIAQNRRDRKNDETLQDLIPESVVIPQKPPVTPENHENPPIPEAEDSSTGI